MAHNLDINNGMASFVSAREDAWHSLGTVLEDSFTAEDAMLHGHLGGWNVRKQELLTADEDGTILTVPKQYAVVRDNPIITGTQDVLGVVGEQYSVMQNEALAELLNNIVDESGAHFETAGAIHGGRKVFLTMKMPEHISVGGVDPVNNYLAVLTSHDGSLSTTMLITPVRIVCQNTMNLAFREASNSFKVRHTSGGPKQLLRQARNIIEFNSGYMDTFALEAERLLDTEMTQTQFNQMIEEAFGAPEDAPQTTITRTDNKLDQMAELFNDSKTHAEVRGTAWAGLNALTEWADHYSMVRPASSRSGAEASMEEVRAVKSVLDPTFKNRALRMVRDFAGV